MNKKLYTTPKGIILLLFFWPYILLYYLVKHLLNRKASTQEATTPTTVTQTSPTATKTSSNGLAKVQGQGLVESMLIPEPTRSLLWVTNEETSKIEQAGSITLTVSISNEGVDVSEKQNGFFAEPSLIWAKLAVKPNSDEVESTPMYWPAYSRFYPETRYQYLRWLKDITQPTNLSFVFLYFYGLERHLLIGEYDAAVDEILRLIDSHPKESFRKYAAGSLIVASIAKGRLDIAERAPFLLEEEIDEALALRIVKGTSMSPEDIISIASRVGFTNKRYIKLQPELFKAELQNEIDKFEAAHGKLLSIFNLKDFKQSQVSVFANLSIPEKVRLVKVPQILEDRQFQQGIKSLLSDAHESVKNILTEQRKSK